MSNKEPEVVAELGYSVILPGEIVPCLTGAGRTLPAGTELITLQSHREAISSVEKLKEHYQDSWSEVCNENQVLLNAIAKKDAALKACVEQNRQLKTALVKWRQKAFPGTYQREVIERDYPEIKEAQQ